MQYTFQQIHNILGGLIVQLPTADAPIQQLLLDSRLLVFPKTTLFFALSGLRNNGHDYLNTLYKKGVRNFVVSQPTAIAHYPEANILQVPDGLTALQQLAAFHRMQFNIPVIGITGSNGKTIVKEWLFQLLHKDYQIVRSPKSYNSQTGVPLSIWQMNKTHELAIFEAGISIPEEMQKLEPIIRPDIGIFTYIGPAHAEGFKDQQQKIEEKLKLFENTNTIIYSADQEIVADNIQKLNISKQLSWSRSGKAATLQIHRVDKLAGGLTEIEGQFEGQQIRFSIPFSDEASIDNALHCCLLLLHLGYAPNIIRQRMEQLETVAMRLELKAGINGCSIINDSYNSDLHSLQIALDFLDQQSSHPQHCLILSDILQSGVADEGLYKNVADLLLEKKTNRFIGIGEAVLKIKKYLPPNVVSDFYSSTDSFLKKLKDSDFRDTAILLKGARQFAFEQIANRLLQRMHKTALEVNLNALIRNLNVYSSLLEADTKIMAMVKAAAYGSGSVEVARLLEFLQVDYLSVAYADEGVELRNAGIQLPILVLNPEEATFEALLRYELEPEIYSLSLLKRFLSILPKGQSASIHLKLDTGMHRLGFELTDIEELVSIVRENPQLQICSVFSHLAASEASEHDDFTKKQVALFEIMYAQITEASERKPLRHILNSAGIVRFPQFQFDMVRLGIGLYGIDSSAALHNQLQAVLSLKATISQIKLIGAADTVGYGRSGKSGQARRIGTVSIGYADGLLRGAGNGRFSLLVHGQKAPIIGNICMDMCMIDVTDIAEAKEGDEVIIFGAGHPVEHLATCLGTIPYEVFTNISGRVRRVYFRE